jgi:Arc/MetJ-type ribon-helix-helix transcriptional regulator
MGRTTKTITISIPPEMEQEIEELMRAEGRTRSELLREALRRYADERRLRSLALEIGQKAREAGITSEEQISELIHAQRRGQE